MADKIPDKFAIQFYFDRHDFVTLVTTAEDRTSAAIQGEDLMNKRVQTFDDGIAVCEVNMQAVRYMRVLPVPRDTPRGWQIGGALPTAVVV